MSLKLGDVVPGFTQDSTEGPLHFFDRAGPSLSNEAANTLFPRGWDEQTPYLRYVKQPVTEPA